MSKSLSTRGFVLIATLLLTITTTSATEVSAGHYFNANNIDIYYEQHGSGEPLLLLHGGLGHSGAWHKQLDALSARFRVILMDSRGHGRSGFDATPISYTLMSQDVLALLDHLGIAQTHLIGWSDGGIIGLELAIHHPERLKSVVAFGANYRPEGVRGDISDNERFSRFISSMATDYQRLSPKPERWQEFLDNIGQMWASEPNYSDAQLGAIATPVLVLAGRDEEAIHIPHVEQTAALIPTAELHIVPGSGHFLHWDKPQVFNRVVLAFLP